MTDPGDRHAGAPPGPGLPVLLQLAGRRCVVLGPPASAAARAAALRAAGAGAVELVSGAAALEEAVAGAFLCLVTEDVVEETARAAAAAARAAGALVWCADRPALSDLTMPAVLRRGRVQIAVAAGGSSPALAARLRDELAGLLGEPLAVFAERLAALRADARARLPDPAARAAHLRGLVAGVRLRGALELPALPEPPGPPGEPTER